MNTLTDAWKILQPARHEETRAQLEAGEVLLAAFEPDLSNSLHYGQGLVILTDRRLISSPADSDQNNASERNWQAWPLTPELSVRAWERGSVGTLELVGPKGRLGHWRYTIGLAVAVHRFVQRFEEFRTPEGAATTASICPTCGGSLDPATGTCPACAAAEAPHSITALFRLIAFARPRARLIALGFLLTLASTVAGLVPPYLTMPLFDRVLIPHQNGQPADFRLVVWLLSGLAGAALLSWILDWRRAFVMARIAEYISADLRARTYSHLQRLSVEFFGGKRTGDLMSRVSNDTDRICNFLSSHLVSFGSDILMIIMTAGVLFTIDPLLALVTLCPFPWDPLESTCRHASLSIL